MQLGKFNAPAMTDAVSLFQRESMNCRALGRRLRDEGSGAQGRAE